MRLDAEGRPLLSLAQAAMLPAFPPQDADLDAIWRWAASLPVVEVPAWALSAEYDRALRRAQGWAS